MSQPQPPADIAYGPATEADLPAVVELCMQVEEQHENYWPLRWQRREGLSEGYMRWMTKRLGDPRMLIQVARDPQNGTRSVSEGASDDARYASQGVPVVGMLLANIMDEIPIYTFKEYAFVQDMAVREAYRRRGIAQRLLADAATWAKGHGLNQLRLMVAHHNPAARATFEKAGFLPTYQEMVLPL